MGGVRRFAIADRVNAYNFAGLICEILIRCFNNPTFNGSFP